MKSARGGSGPVTTLKGIGPRLAERLGRIGIESVQDLLFHLPHRYEDRTRVVPIGTLRPGDRAVVEGEVLLADIKYGRRRMLVVRLTDGTGSLTLRFFHFSAAQKSGLVRGSRLRCFGEVRRGASALEMAHPEYQRLAETSPPVEEHLTPVYAATEGLQQTSIRRLIQQAFEALARGEGPVELLPPQVLEEFGWPTLSQALHTVHFPPPEVPLSDLEQGCYPAQQRLAFEELLAHYMSLRRLRQSSEKHTAPKLNGEEGFSTRFIEKLPFSLTAAQERVWKEITADLRRNFPMQRLVQGDVGSGKTVVAALAALQAVEAGYQAAVMAPTELLAEQHYRNFSAWLAPLGITVVWLSGKSKTAARREALHAITEGEAALAIGTHALFQESVTFRALGLVIVDEQHRFGVHQRLALREKGAFEGGYPHQLIMTATPIPRTLAMTAYADLDVSVIDELPPGRSPVETVVIPENRREEVIERVRLACGQGRQAYWVCTLIEESESLQCQAAEDTAELLASNLPDLKVGLVHGRLKPDEKERIMKQFQERELDLLVATTVIEVGVDVPNASLMIIENAERLGLAQLHQLRGRVGRGAARSSCVLMYSGPLSRSARERLAVLRETNDGFIIARKDLELRGPGELLGTRQTGLLQLRIADLQRDRALLERVPKAAEVLLCNFPETVSPLIDRWLPGSERYGNV